ncbi:MAG: shikimate dehydrogenase [Bacteroidota bacterium]
MTTGSQKRYGIIGHPIGHSLSPLLYTTAFRLCGLSHTYESFDLERSKLADDFRRLLDEGYAGFNVTIPHKESIMQHLSEIDPEATAVGAVNTIVVRESGTLGLNTDVYGVTKLFEPSRRHINGKDVLLLGAGGAARAAVVALQKNFHPSHILLASRSSERGKKFAGSFPSIPIEVTDFSVPRLQVAARSCSVIVNTTPIGMHPRVEESPLPKEVQISSSHLVIDLIYTPFETTFMSDAARAGATSVGGVEMLLHQAARAFEMWTGMKMPVEEVRKVVERKLRDKV